MPDSPPEDEELFELELLLLDDDFVVELDFSVVLDWLSVLFMVVLFVSFVIFSVVLLVVLFVVLLLPVSDNPAKIPRPIRIIATTAINITLFVLIIIPPCLLFSIFVY